MLIWEHMGFCLFCIVLRLVSIKCIFCAFQSVMKRSFYKQRFCFLLKTQNSSVERIQTVFVVLCPVAIHSVLRITALNILYIEPVSLIPGVKFSTLHRVLHAVKTVLSLLSQSVAIGSSLYQVLSRAASMVSMRSSTGIFNALLNVMQFSVSTICGFQYKYQVSAFSYFVGLLNEITTKGCIVLVFVFPQRRPLI